MERFRKQRPLGYRDHVIDIGIALENALAAAEYHHVEFSRGKAAPDAANERRCEQHISETSQRNHQDAGSAGQIEGWHGSVRP